MSNIIKNKKNILNYSKALFYRLKKVSNLLKLKRLDIPALKTSIIEINYRNMMPNINS